MKGDLTHQLQTPVIDRRRVLAPRTSEEEALFIARKYLENKAILEAKLANAVNGGRFLRQNMLGKSPAPPRRLPNASGNFHYFF